MGSGSWQVHSGSRDSLPSTVTNIGKGLKAPKSFSISGISSMGLKHLIPIKMDRPLGGVLLYAVMSCFKSIMKVKDLNIVKP